MDEKTQKQIIQLVQAAMQGNQQANQLIQQIAQAAQQGDQQAQALFSVIQLVAQKLQGVQSAKQGAKLNYIRSLKSKCNADEELVYLKAGGKVCPVCQKKKQVKKACGGAVASFKAKFSKCGGKVKKNEIGGTVQDKKTQQKPTKLPRTYDRTTHERLIREFQKNGRKLPKEKMDSLQWYNRHDPNEQGV